MKITLALKTFMIASHGVAADASDDVFKKAVADHLADGTLSFEKVHELTAAKAADAESRVRAMVAEEVAKAFTTPEVAGAIAKAFSGKVGGDGGQIAPAASATASKAFGAAAGSSAGSAAEFDASWNQVRVKSVAERFDASTRSVTWDMSENPFIAKSFGGRQVYSANPESGGYALQVPSQLSKAVTGAWFKHMVNKARRNAGLPVAPLNEQDRELLLYAVHECQFTGPVKSFEGAEFDLHCQKLSNDFWKKTLLDDSVSGGLEAVPIEFDAAVILTPILNGELFPLVDVRNVQRRRIEATAIGNPTVSWGGASGTSISLFNTDSFISAFDNNIHVIDGAMEMGRDFLADSPLDVAGIVQNRYGEKFKQELDNVIATGDGTTQPEGLFTAAGVTVVTPAGGNGAAPQVGDYEGLMHGIAKEYQQEAGLPPASRMVFIGTQTSYKRGRGIPVDSSNDARRIFGQDNQMDYRLMGLRYCINESLTNAQIGCFCLNRYRMYRRLGFEVAIASQDAQSLRRNTQTIVVRARFGGSLEKSAAGTKITAAQA